LRCRGTAGEEKKGETKKKRGKNNRGAGLSFCLIITLPGRERGKKGVGTRPEPRLEGEKKKKKKRGGKPERKKKGRPGWVFPSSVAQKEGGRTSEKEKKKGTPRPPDLH